MILGIAFAVSSCSKQDEVSLGLDLENLYEIKDDPSDSIQHKRYEIYKDFQVAVFFNDTVGKVFVKQDVYGDSVFQYECLDPNWTFTGYNKSEYTFQYMTDPGEQSYFLNMIREFLSSSAKTLHPYSILITNNYTVLDNNTQTLKSNGEFKIFYKLMIVTGTKSTNLKGKPTEIIREMITNRITAYKDLLSTFNRVSKNYIGKSGWTTLGVGKLSVPVTYMVRASDGTPLYEQVVTNFGSYPFSYGFSCLDDGWWGEKSFSKEEVALIRLSARTEVAKFGFVGPSIAKGATSMTPPKDENDDLLTFVKEVMRRPQKEFRELWGDFPLVMQKYEILLGVLTNDLGIEL